MIGVVFYALIAVACGIAPSTKFDLRKWYITLPDATDVPPNKLSNGYDDPNKWFTLSPDNEMRFTVPGNGKHTDESVYPRSELREMPTIGVTDADSRSSNWMIKTGLRHTMNVTTQVVKCDPAVVIIGQIHGKLTTTQVLVKIYWGPYTSGGRTYNLHARVKTDPASKDEEHLAWFFSVPLGQKVKYMIDVSGTNLRLRAGLEGTTMTAPYRRSGSSFETSTTSSLSIAGWSGDYGYFKVGAYFLTTTHLSTEVCTVDVSAFSVYHSGLAATTEDPSVISDSSTGLIHNANTGLLAGVIVAATLFIVMLIILVVVIVRKKRTEIV